MDALKSVNIPGDLFAEMQAEAESQGKTADALFAEAGRSLLNQRRLRGFVAENRILALRQGLRDCDVERLIDEARQDRPR